MNATPSNRQASGYRPSKYGCPMRRQTNKCDSKFISDPVLGEFMINYILNLMNAQKDFRNVHSPEELGKRLLHGSTFDDVASIDNDGLEELFRVLSEYSGENSEFLKKPSVNKSGDSENEIRKLREEKKKTERALDRLKRIYLYSDEAISEKEFLIEKKALTDHLEEVNESLGMVEKDSWNLNMTDADFIAQASSFIISQQLQDREYIYFKKLHMSTDPAVLKEFFRSIVDSITIYNGRVDCIVFRNGLSQQFSYKEESQGC